MRQIIGSGFIGSPSLQTSTANQEVVPTKPAGWTHGYNLYKFSFMNDQDCVVIINNLAPIFLRAGQGMNVEQMDSPVWSFKITTSGITYNFVGAY